MYLLETFVWVLALRNFRFGSYLCLLTRFAAFGLLALGGPPCGLRPAITRLAALRPFTPYVLEISFLTFHIGGSLYSLGHCAPSCLPALDGPPRGLRPTIALKAALCPLTPLWIVWPCYRFFGPAYASGRFVCLASLRPLPISLIRPLCGLWP